MTANTIKLRDYSLSEVNAIIGKDFIERDGKSFVFQKSGRTPWEQNLAAGKAISEAFHGDLSHFFDGEPHEWLTRVHAVIGRMFDSMDLGTDVKTVFDNGFSCTDGSVVNVNSKVFDDESMDMPHRLDVCLGFAHHEALHIEFTDFSEIQKENDSIVRNLGNMIEDERIEHLSGEKYPGFVNYLKAAKYFSFDKYIKDRSGDEKLNYFTRLINAILAMVRYPAVLNDTDKTEFGRYLVPVYELMRDHFPQSNKESLELARRIYDIIKEAIKDKQTEQKNQKKESEKNSESSESSGKGDSQPDGQQQSSANSESNSDNGNDTGDSSSSSSSQDKSPASDKGSASQKGANDTASEEALEKVRNALDKMMQNIEQNSSGQSSFVQSEDDIDGILKGTVSYGSKRNVKFHKPELNSSSEAVYITCRDEVRRFIPAIRKALVANATTYTDSLKGMRNGKLDDYKLVDAVLGSPNVYLQKEEVKADRVSVCVLLDESGSMYGAGEESARRTAVLLNEALGTVDNVDLYIYGHTGTKSTTSLFTYREGGRFDKYALGSTDSRAGNHDDIAILEAATRVRKFTKDPVLMFVVSDGAPNCPAVNVRNAVASVTRDRFTVVGISIDSYYNPAKLYANNVNLTDLEKLPLDLSKMVKKAVLKKTATR